MNDKSAKYGIGSIVRHRVYPFRGVVVDVDPEFDNTDEWYEAIPAEVRPDKEQPFYHLLAENSDSYYLTDSPQSLINLTNVVIFNRTPFGTIKIKSDSSNDKLYCM